MGYEDGVELMKQLKSYGRINPKLSKNTFQIKPIKSGQSDIQFFKDRHQTGDMMKSSGKMVSNGLVDVSGQEANETLEELNHRLRINELTTKLLLE